MARAPTDLLPNWLGALAVAASHAQRMATAEAGSDSRLAALLTLRESPGATVGELAGVLVLSHSAVVRVVDGLVADGLVRRGGDGVDARRVALVLTEDGKRTADRLQRARLHALDRLLEPLQSEQRSQLADLLDVLMRGTGRDRLTARRTCRFCAHRACTGSACPVGSSVSLLGPLQEAR